MDLAIYTAVEDRRVFRGARLLRVGSSIPLSVTDFHTVRVGVQISDSEALDFVGDGYNGSQVDLPSGSSGFLTGLEEIDEALPVGSVVMARIETVGNPPPLTGASVLAVIGWANAP